MSRNRSANGRIMPHQPATDNTVAILCDNLEISNDFAAETCETEKRKMLDKNRRDYRNRIKEIIEFWKEEKPDYHLVGVRALTDEEVNDPEFFAHNNTEDIIYQGLNAKFVKAFLVFKKRKPNGTLCSCNLRKFKDALV